MNLLFYFGHPAQYHFLKYSVKELRDKGHHTTIVIKTKDVLEDLLKENNEEYYNILPEGRKESKIQILGGLIKRDFRLFRYVFNKKIDLLIGTDPSLSHVGWLLRIPVVTVLEDDIDVIPSLAKLTFPFTSHIVTPNTVRVGRFSKKQIRYDGYMKLAYLHPGYFSAKDPQIDQPYFLIRLSGLEAYHDFGINGLNESLLDAIITKLSKNGFIYISSEKSLPAKYDRHLLEIKHSEIHHYLANAAMLISDSQSMSMEAAMLGVPSIRFSDFAGRISVLEELENKYQLTFGIKTSESQQLLERITELLSDPEMKATFQSRRKKMLSEKIDVTAFMVWLIENYPESVKIMKENPDYQYRFK
jgi:predicted glycosyltransferase